MITKTTILESVSGKIELKTVALDPKEFFQDREGLWVSSSFKERIRDKAEKSEAGEVILSSFKLLKSSEDKDIEAELPEKHIFSETEVCAIIAALIEKQPKGEEGELLANGYFNLFYTPSFVAGVRWFSFDSCWRVDAWARDDYWGSYDRVFSPATLKS